MPSGLGVYALSTSHHVNSKETIVDLVVELYVQNPSVEGKIQPDFS